MWDEMLSIGVLLAQAQFVVLVIARVPTGNQRWSSGPRALAALLAALVIPAVVTSWLLLASVPLWFCKAISILLLLAASGGWLRLPYQRWSSVLWAPQSWWLVLPIVILTALTVLGAALKPEGSIDGLLYHGPQLANLLVKESLFGWESANEYVYYPGLQMVLLSLWWDALGHAFGEDIIQAPYVALATLALYVASSQTTNYRLTRMWMAALVVASPVAWMQARILYVDVAAAALVVTAVALSAFAIRAHASVPLLFAALAGGAAFATKPSGLVLGALVIGFGVAAGLLLRSRLVLLIPVVAALAAMPFYLRNVIAFANPIFPIGLKRGPLELPGIVDSSQFYSTSASSGVADVSRLYQAARDVWIGVRDGPARWLYDPREGGFAQTPLLLVVLLIGLIVTVVLVRAYSDRRRVGPLRFREEPQVTSMGASAIRRPDWIVWAMLALAVLGTVLQPNAMDSRYLIAQAWLVAAAAISAASLLPQFPLADRSWALLTAVATLLILLWMEAVMLFGIRESITLKYGPSLYGGSQGVPNYNTGVSGTAVASGDNFEWLRGQGCATVLVESAGGLGPTGMSGLDGLLTTLQYPLWGDGLCNDVRFHASGDVDSARDSVVRLTEIGRQDASVFLVLNSSSAPEWETWLVSQEIFYETVFRTPEVDDFSVEQIVLRIWPPLGESEPGVSGEPSLQGPRRW